MSLLRWKQKLFADGGVARGGDGGGGSSSPSPSPSPTQTTVQNTNIPEYAQPYVETMLGAAQQQIFNYDNAGNVTSMKPYVPYSSNPQDYVAGFSPLQQQAQSNVANMTTPQQYQDASQMAGAGILGSFGLAGQEAQTGRNLAQASTNPYAVGAYMNPYIQNALAPSQQLLNQQYGMQGAAQQGAATQAGAFGGSRNALMQGLNEQNRMLAQNQLVGNAYQNAFGQAQNQMNAVAAQGLAGQQAAMQGLGQGIQGAGTLGTLGGQQAQTALGINAAQQASGAAQQAQQQNIINQAVQNYATQQQYPMLQLANMSSLLRGLPMQSATTQTYQAAPSAVSQLGGLGATALGAYGASGGFKSNAEGGIIKEYATGGQVAFDVGGAVEADLENMDTPQLVQQAKTSPSATVRQEAIRILTERQAEAAMAKGVGANAPVFQAAGGGIVAFVDNKDQPVSSDMPATEDAPKLTKEEAEAVLYGRLPKGSLDRLEPKRTTKDSVEFNNLQKANTNPNEWHGPIDFLSSLYNPKRIDPKTGLALTQSEFEQGPTYPPTAPAAKPTAPVSNVPAAPTNPQRPGLSGTPQADGAGAPADTSGLTGYEAEIKKRLGMMDEGLGNTKAQADLDALRKEIGASKNDKLWQALMTGGLKAMASRSPWGGVGIGEGGAEGVKAYADASKAEREDKKLLIAQQSALDQAEYARKTGNLNALIAAQARLDVIKQHRDNLKLQYANIGATKEAALSAAKIKAHGDTVVKLMAQGMDETQASDLADRLYSSNKIAALPEGVKVTKVKG